VKKDLKEECIRVAVRLRPMSSQELEKEDRPVARVQQDLVLIQKLQEDGKLPQSPKSFTFDYAYDEFCSQLDLYSSCA
jgi:hypothetical protein